jgi:hypothetical protein
MESNAVRNDGSAWDAELRFASNGLATATLVVLLICASRESLAESGVSVAMVGNASVSSLATTGSMADYVPAATRPKVRRLNELDALMAVRLGPKPVTARETDASIAAAVARGNDKKLERPNPFRKKSSDLFRSQRQIQIGDEEMVMRLRVRPKTRNAMSVEFRF